MFDDWWWCEPTQEISVGARGLNRRIKHLFSGGGYNKRELSSRTQKSVNASRFDNIDSFKTKLFPFARIGVIVIVSCNRYLQEVDFVSFRLLWDSPLLHSQKWMFYASPSF